MLLITSNSFSQWAIPPPTNLYKIQILHNLLSRLKIDLMNENNVSIEWSDGSNAEFESSFFVGVSDPSSYSKD